MAVTAIQPFPRPGVILDYWFPPLAPSRGLYELNDGELIAGNLLVDLTGTYRQAGGTSDFDFVAIHDEGQFRLRGGALHADHGFHSNEAVDLGGREVTLSVGAGILDFSNGIAGAHNAHIAAGPDSLAILPAGFNPNTGFGTFNRQGMVHVAGRDLVLPAGKRIAGAGVIDDFVTARGQIAAADYGINLTKGLRLQSDAAVDLGNGALAAVGRATTFQGGDLSARQLVVGGTLNDPWERQFQRNSYDWPFDDHQLADSPGVIRHTAGDVQIAERATILSGLYRISGGELDADRIDVGVNQWHGEQEEVAARFVQTGGTVRTSRLTLSQVYVYPLAFDLAHGVTDLQRRSNSEFTAATNDDIRIEPPSNDLVIAPFIGPTAIHSSYRLEAGELIADHVELSQFWFTGSTTRFLQTGGTLVSNRRITMHGPETSYIIDGGQLTARRIEIGAQYVLTNPEYVVPDSATFAVRDADSQIEIRGQLLLGGGSQFRAVPGTAIRMTNPEQPLEGDWLALPASSFRNLSFDADNLSGLKNLTLVFDGHTNEASTFEVAGLDFGPGPGGYQHNFALAGLTLGGDSPASLQLTDLIDNQRNGDFNEALYVDTLIVGPGSTLDIGRLNLYYRHAEIAGTVLSSTGALLAATQVPEPAAATMLLVAATLGYGRATNATRS
ncbi:MAG: hypothetical protein H0T51_18570, partial [Pirellulales bacterium]|nr:hypothetical protein [Pirellulales bacterium]